MKSTVKVKLSTPLTKTVIGKALMLQVLPEIFILPETLVGPSDDSQVEVVLAKAPALFTLSLQKVVNEPALVADSPLTSQLPATSTCLQAAWLATEPAPSTAASV